MSAHSAMAGSDRHRGTCVGACEPLDSSAPDTFHQCVTRLAQRVLARSGASWSRPPRQCSKAQDSSDERHGYVACPRGVRRAPSWASSQAQLEARARTYAQPHASTHAHPRSAAWPVVGESLVTGWSRRASHHFSAVRQSTACISSSIAPPAVGRALSYPRGHLCPDCPRIVAPASRFAAGRGRVLACTPVCGISSPQRHHEHVVTDFTASRRARAGWALRSFCGQSRLDPRF